LRYGEFQIKSYLITRNNFEFDQLILEFWKGEEEPNSGWVHVSCNKRMIIDDNVESLDRNEDEKIVYKPY
jgi:hypothetical protein